MRQYDKYINPGLEWISRIPSHWSSMPLKRYGRFNKGLTFTKADLVEDGHPVVSYGQVHSKNNNGTHLNDELIRFVPERFIENSYNSFVRKGDFIFADTSEDLEGSGNVVYNDKDMLIYGGYHTVLFQTKNDDNRYLAYLFSTDCWRSQVRSRVSGIKVFSITQGILSMTNIILPPEDEQKVIADYLDEKTAQIDNIIRARKKKILLLEELKASIITKAVTKGIKKNVMYKDSGIAWIGSIPSHWDICPLKRCLSLKNGQDYKHIETEKGFPVYGSGGVFKHASKYLYDGESVLFGRKGTIDRPLYVVGKFWTVDTMFYSIPKVGINCKYMYYQGLTIPFDRYSTSTALPSMTQTDLGSHIVCKPPIEEQNKIVMFIDNQLNLINNNIGKAQYEIELLKEYRSSLVTEVVTGKRKVI